jgi:hypothetical protein
MVEKLKLVVKTESKNVWWGIYGFCEKTGWEDLNIFNDRGEKIAAFCLNGKRYLRNGVADLRNNPGEENFVQAIDNYIADDKIHYWFYYNDEYCEEFYEVGYDAPRNDLNEKPRYMDLWHPDETIDISTIRSAVKNFAKVFLNAEVTDIEIEPGDTFADALHAYKEYMKDFGPDAEIHIAFSDDLVEKLSAIWGTSTEATEEKLRKAIT